jgi:hypothetical protein
LKRKLRVTFMGGFTYCGDFEMEEDKIPSLLGHLISKKSIGAKIEMGSADSIHDDQLSFEYCCPGRIISPSSIEYLEGGSREIIETVKFIKSLSGSKEA